jgi:hypothetical protein
VAVDVKMMSGVVVVVNVFVDDVLHVRIYLLVFVVDVIVSVDDVVHVHIYLLVIVVVVIVFVDVVHVRIYLLVIVVVVIVFVDVFRIYLLVIVVVVIVSVDVVVIVLVAVVGDHAHQVVGSQQHRQKSKGVETTPLTEKLYCTEYYTNIKNHFHL